MAIDNEGVGTPDQNSEPGGKLLMLRALLYLKGMSFRNRILGGIRRMRQPKYLVSVLAGAAYFYLFFFHSPSHLARIQPSAAQALDLSSALPLGAAVLFVLLMGSQAMAWLPRRPAPVFRFSEAEIAFLFPAPLTRRERVHFTLLGTQLAVFLSAVVLELLFNRSRPFGAHRLIDVAGWWIILSARSLHSTAARLLRARLADFPAARPVAIGILAAVAALAIGSVWHNTAALTFESNAAEPLPARTIRVLLEQGPIHGILWPLTWLVAPFAAPDFRAFAFSLSPALVILAVVYAWIVRSEGDFEEGSIAFAEERARLRAARQGGRISPAAPAGAKAQREPFRLGDKGAPEIAFLWKNLIAARAWLNYRAAVRLLPIFVAVALTALPHSSGHRSGTGLSVAVFALAIFSGAFALLAGPQLLRQDLRSDLGHSDLLKTYPLPGWRVVLGELLTPVLILSGFIWLCLLAAAWALARSPEGPGWGLGPIGRIALIACAGAIVPPICALRLLVPNAAAILLPGWYPSTTARSFNLDVIGQRLIFSFGQMAAVALAALPAALLAPAVFVAAKFWAGLFAPAPLALLLAAAAAAASAVLIVGGELWCGIWWLGRRFEKFDSTA